MSALRSFLVRAEAARLNGSPVPDGIHVAFEELANLEDVRATLERWMEEDGGAVKGYIAHADIRWLFEHGPESPPARSSQPQNQDSGGGRAARGSYCDEATDSGHSSASGLDSR